MKSPDAEKLLLKIVKVSVRLGTILGGNERNVEKWINSESAFFFGEKPLHLIVAGRGDELLDYLAQYCETTICEEEVEKGDGAPVR
jgi:hypothetical protein